MFDLAAIQDALRRFGIDGWLLYDFRGSNVLARRILQLTEQHHSTRRCFYSVPAEGSPRKLVHRIEAAALDHLPGEKLVYLSWQEMEAGVAQILHGLRTVAMEYAPLGSNPYVARVDAGTIELVRRCGAHVVSSGDLIQQFEAEWTDEQWQMHLEAARHTDSAFGRAWQFIAKQVLQNGFVRETEVQQLIMEHFTANGLVTDHPPIVAVGPHSGDPHYAPSQETDTAMREGDLVLIDLWAKLDRLGAVYSDLTRVGFIGSSVPQKYQRVFDIVAAARDAAIERVREAFTAGAVLQGWQVDRAARDVIDAAGYGQYFIHRTGHSIGQETHGNGTNMDDLETHDERRVLPRTCFSIEPGIYLDDFGIRSEVNVYINATDNVHVTGGEVQRQIHVILARP